MRTLKDKVQGWGRGTSGHRGFTLIELLVVIAIISILAGLTMPVLRTARIRAREAAAQSMIASLQIALSMYETDFGMYPTDGIEDGYTTPEFEADNRVIIELLTGENRYGEPLPWTDPGDPTYKADWHGPYFEVRREDIDAYGRLIDPWGNPYVIVFDRDNDPVTGPPFHNSFGVDIFSVGPDGTTSSGGTANVYYAEWIDESSDGDSGADDNPPNPYNDDDINNW